MTQEKVKDVWEKEGTLIKFPELPIATALKDRQSSIASRPISLKATSGCSRWSISSTRQAWLADAEYRCQQGHRIMAQHVIKS